MLSGRDPNADVRPGPADCARNAVVVYAPTTASRRRRRTDITARTRSGELRPHAAPHRLRHTAMRVRGGIKPKRNDVESSPSPGPRDAMLHVVPVRGRSEGRCDISIRADGEHCPYADVASFFRRGRRGSDCFQTMCNTTPRRVLHFSVGFFLTRVRRVLSRLWRTVCVVSYRVVVIILSRTTRLDSDSRGAASRYLFQP